MTPSEEAYQKFLKKTLSVLQYQYMNLNDSWYVNTYEGFIAGYESRDEEVWKLKDEINNLDNITLERDELKEKQDKLVELCEQLLQVYSGTDQYHALWEKLNKITGKL